MKVNRPEDGEIHCLKDDRVAALVVPANTEGTHQLLERVTEMEINSHEGEDEEEIEQNEIIDNDSDKDLGH